MCKTGVLRRTSLALQKAPVKYRHRDFPGGAVVKNLPSNAGNMGLIPGWGTKITQAAGQLSLRATTAEPQLERIPCATAKILPDTNKTQHSE